MRPSHRCLAVAALMLVAACRSPGPPPPGPTPGAATEFATAATAAKPATVAALPTTNWWDGRVFYEIFVRSFADSTTGPLANDGTGDLQGLIERLDYLNDGNPATTTDLGITGIWLMPISPSPSYHGYDVTDYYGVNPDYGTTDDLRRLVVEAHKRGIRVIVDLVLNHSSSRHPRFRQALRGDPLAQDWYIFVPADQVPTIRGPWDQVVWHESNRLHYYGVFWEGMPDLNYRNPAVTGEAYRVADFWLRDMGVDGFRLDAVRYMIEDGAEMADTPETIEWLAGFRAHVKSVNAAALTLGEVWTNTEIVSDYIDRGALDLAFEFDLAGAILDAARSGTKDKLAYTIDNVAASYPHGRYATMITNHDQERVASELDEDPARMKLAASILLTLPGVPFMYYGEEIGQIGTKPDEMIRNPMPWTGGRHGGFTGAAQPWEPLQPGHEKRNVAAQDAETDSLLNHYRRLLRLRQAVPALAFGEVRTVETGRNDVIAWERAAGAERVTVVANLSQETIRGYRLPQASGGFNREMIANRALDPTAGLTLAPLSLYVLNPE
jgi:glycosidase